MPLYDICTNDISKKFKPVSANSEQEARGKARERYAIPDDEECFAFAQDESEVTQDFTRMAETVHQAMMSVFVNRNYARDRDRHATANQLTGVYVLLMSAYEGLTAPVRVPERRRRRKTA